jgi:hypothetical protein
VIVNFANPGGSFLGSSGSAAPFTTDAIPDVLEKVAFDPGWAHFEVFGLQRFFTDGIFTCNIVTAGLCTPLSTANTGSTNNHTTMGAGIGGSFLWPVLPNHFELTGMAMAGSGIGRYNAALLPDVIVAGDGTLHPIREASGMGGAIWHPWVGTDIYVYTGIEKEDANWYTGLTAAGVTQLGVGNPNVVNFGCEVTTATSFSGGTSNCNGATRWVTDVAAGIWQNLYSGPVGRVALGLQWELITRKLFPGLSAPPLGSPLIAPSATNNMFLTSVRYYPNYPAF